MRFLLNPSSCSVVTTMASSSIKTTATSKSITKILGSASIDSVDDENNMKITSTTKKMKWGQQCGVSCGCVLRFEIQLDQHDCVISAEYTAKRIITTTLNFGQKHHSSNTAATNNTSSVGYQRRPVLTNRTGKLQYVPSNCKALHQLSSSTIQYFMNRPIWQIMNYHEFQNSRSSVAFQQSVLSIHKLTPSSASSMSIPNSIDKHHRSNKVLSATHHNNTSQKQYHNCFDLVEDAVTALLKGYVPVPRNTMKAMNTIDNSPSNFVSSDDTFPYTFEDVDHEEKEIQTSKHPITTSKIVDIQSWFERPSNMNMFQYPWWPKSWRRQKENEFDDSIAALKPTSEKNYRMEQQSHYNDDHRHRWTAVDWMDWFEIDRQTKLYESHQQQNHNLWKNENFLFPIRRRYNEQPSHNLSNWLSYVDALYYNYEGNNNEQSA